MEKFLEFLHTLRQSHPEWQEELGRVEYMLSVPGAAWGMADFSFLHYPPGHYACPLPSLKEIENMKDRAFNRESDPLPGLACHADAQFRLAEQLLEWYPRYPYFERSQPGLRYYEPNGWFPHGDAFWLFAFMNTLAPRRIVEVGSGFSSALMLDVNEFFLNRQVEFHFIEPYPQNRLAQLLNDEDRNSVHIYETLVQNISLESFALLQENDILFIDSSHVAKVGSDVLFLLQHVLPALNPGVFIHIHDIPAAFEFPYEQYTRRREAWNEMYLLRSFLQFNNAFEILLFPDWLLRSFPQKAQELFPAPLRNGASFWMRKIA